MQNLTGKELTTILVSLFVLGLLLTPFSQDLLQSAAQPLVRITLPAASSQEPQAPDQTGNVLRYTSEPFRRNVIVVADEPIQEGALAIVDDALAGVVQENSDRYTTVQLLADPQFRGVVETSRGAKGVIEGRLNALLLSKVPQNQTLESGDVVFTSGLDGRFDEGIAIGVVREVYNESDLLKSAYVEPYVDFANLESLEFIDA